MGNLCSRVVRERVELNVKLFILHEHIMEDEQTLTDPNDGSKPGVAHLEKEGD